MLGFITELLIEFGLIRADYKHRKKVAILENTDGKSRPFQKYLLQPTFLVVLIVLVVVSIAIFKFISYQRTSLYPTKTKKEVIEMIVWAEKWHTKFKQYPANIDELIGNDPTRQSWKTDAWGLPYQYSISNNGKDLMIRSASADGKFETKDDITSHNQHD